MVYDFIVVGAGIAGANIAYLLKKAGKKVIVLEKDTIASGGSGAAGAFLSPKICSNSIYTKFINRSYLYALDFYEKNFSQCLDKKGMLRILKNSDDINKCKDIDIEYSYLPSYKLNFLKDGIGKNGAFLFKSGAIINSKKIIYSLLKDIVVIERSNVKNIYKENENYNINGIVSKKVIFCAGNAKEIEELNYLNLKDIYGHRVEVTSDERLPFNMHKSYSISTNQNGTIHIGATHIPSYKKDQSDIELDKMINEVKKYIKFNTFKIEKIHYNKRNATFDFFPVVGKLINDQETLLKYPSIKNGTKIPKDRYIYHRGLYTISGVGARGFVLSPYLAKILFRYIFNVEAIPSKLDTIRLFLRYARKRREVG